MKKQVYWNKFNTEIKDKIKDAYLMNYESTATAVIRHIEQLLDIHNRWLKIDLYLQKLADAFKNEKK